jgi:hypothetical protein
MKNKNFNPVFNINGGDFKGANFGQADNINNHFGDSENVKTFIEAFLTLQESAAQTLSDIFNKMYEKLDTISIQNDDRKKYEDRIDLWLPNSNWKTKLSDASKSYLISAEYLADTIARSNVDDDFSASICQYCRVIENELKINLFQKAEAILQPEVADSKTHMQLPAIKTALTLSLSEVNTIYSAINLDKKRSLEAIVSTLELFRDRKSIILLNTNTSVLFKKFNSYLNSTFQKTKLLKSTFIDSIKQMKNDYRNKAAHGGALMSQTDLQHCQILVKSILQDWLVILK